VLPESLDLRVQLPIERLQGVAPIGRVRQKRQRREGGLTLGAPQPAASTNALAKRHRLQGVLDARAHAHPLMTVEEQCA
jgi:hypothetical protein